MTRVAAAGVAVLLLLSLSGCSLFARHDDAEGPLREQIGDLASVVEVGSDVNRVFGVSVWVWVSELDESDLHAIVAAADELLAGREVTFTIAFGQSNLLLIDYPNEFSPEQLDREVDYWLALSSANEAPLGIMLEEGPRRNIWDPDESDTVDWDALRAVPDPSGASLTWNLDGTWSARTMPTEDVIAFRDRLAAIPLGDYEKLTLNYFTPGYVEVRYVSPEAGLVDPTVASNWPRVQEIVSELVSLGLPQSNFVFNTHGFTHAAALHLGECAEVARQKYGWTSAELVDALTTSGIEFPLGVSTGYCDDVR